MGCTPHSPVYRFVRGNVLAWVALAEALVSILTLGCYWPHWTLRLLCLELDRQRRTVSRGTSKI